MDSPTAIVIYLIVLVVAVAVAWRLIAAVVRRLAGTASNARARKPSRRALPPD